MDDNALGGYCNPFDLEPPRGSTKPFLACVYINGEYKKPPFACVRLGNQHDVVVRLDDGQTTTMNQWANLPAMPDAGDNWTTYHRLAAALAPLFDQAQLAQYVMTASDKGLLIRFRKPDTAIGQAQRLAEFISKEQLL